MSGSVDSHVHLLRCVVLCCAVVCCLQVGEKFNMMLARTVHTDGTPETGMYDQVGNSSGKALVVEAAVAVAAATGALLCASGMLGVPARCCSAGACWCSCSSGFGEGR
jgi:hypothetical protein